MLNYLFIFTNDEATCLAKMHFALSPVISYAPSLFYFLLGHSTIIVLNCLFMVLFYPLKWKFHEGE